MSEVEFPAGKIVFREGDPTDYAYLIQSGQVEILKLGAVSNVRVALLGPGDVFGEMGVIDELPRSATARTVDVVRAVALDQKAFINMLLCNRRDSLSVFRSLCERLRTMTDRFRDAEDQKTDARPTIGKVFMCASGEAGNGSDADSPWEVTRFPYRVGRQPLPEEGQTLAFNDYQIPDSEPHTLSLNHFLLDLTLRGIVCRDRGSRFGTIVNGVRIGGNTGRFSQSLKLERNEIVAGPADSPFRFTVDVKTA